MPASTSADARPDSGRVGAGEGDSETPDGLPSGCPAGSETGSGTPREPVVEPPLLRGDGGRFTGRGESLDSGSDPDSSGPARVQAIVSQLTPIGSRAALLASFEREANQNDQLVVAAYACAWAALALGVSRSTTRRARIRATLARARSNSLTGRG